MCFSHCLLQAHIYLYRVEEKKLNKYGARIHNINLFVPTRGRDTREIQVPVFPLLGFMFALQLAPWGIWVV